jgi:ubiquinone/menaquinone biosynthesis C-methylase UbiE
MTTGAAIDGLRSMWRLPRPETADAWGASMTARRGFKQLAKRMLPSAWWDAMRVAAGRARVSTAVHEAGQAARSGMSRYEDLYEEHARVHDPDAAVGDGSFDLIGRIELSVLTMEGLRATDTLIDFGCGTGRLAIHAVAALAGGRYIGIDISRSMLDGAHRRIEAEVPGHSCEVSLIHQGGYRFPVPDESVDMLCAFSVFTHMEHEDCYQYLKSARRVLRPGGKLIFSCLPMDIEAARRIFVQSASIEISERWMSVRNVTTSRDFMEQIASLAGWRTLRWYPGDQATIRLIGTGDMHGLGQSVCVLRH